MSLPRACLDCGKITTNGSRCKRCEARRNRARGTAVQRYGEGWHEISRRVIARDHGICHLCGQPGADTADHLIPRSRGGRSEMKNLAAAHRACNSQKGPKTSA